MLNRLRLQRDPTLYAPSYAVLLGAFLSSAIALALVQPPVVRSTALLILGVSVGLAGIHSMLYRHEHTNVMQHRFGLAYYRAWVFVVLGMALLLMGVATATFAYIALIHP
jgi:hypothetical protein